MRCHTPKRRYGDKTETVPWETGRRERAEFLSPDESRCWYKLFKTRPRDADAEVSFAQAHNNSIPNKKLLVSPQKRFCDGSPSAHCMKDAAVLSVAETELQGIYVVSQMTDADSDCAPNRQGYGHQAFGFVSQTSQAFEFFLSMGRSGKH